MAPLFEKIRETDEIDSKMGSAEIQKCFRLVFNLVCKILDTGIVYEDKDFEPEAEGIISFINHVPKARIALRFFGPVVAVVAMIEKIQNIIEAKQATKVTKQVPLTEFESYKEAVDSRPQFK